MGDSINILTSASPNEDNIKHYIARGREYEESGNSSNAIENYVTAASLINKSTEGNVKFDVYIKLGDIYQLIGKLDEALIGFQNAYNVSLSLGDKFLQVDSLIRIANIFLYKNEANTGLRYIEAAESILIDTEYTKGKLETSLFRSRYYYFCRENFKAREICINAIKACEEDYQLYKGIFLNLFAELSSSLVSDEEYLSILNQAYDCFTMTGFKRGMLGILNNIGHLYAAKMQDYEKALECYTKLRIESENSIFTEFRLIAYLNTGETYFKSLKYNEALTWFLDAKTKPCGAYSDNARLYNNVFIAHTYLKLYEYSNAYEYFILASKEVNSGSTISNNTLINYYNLASLLYCEFGKSEEAISYSKKALEAATDEQSVLKWETGTIYELIKLKQAKNETEVFGVLEGVRHLVTKYSNSNTILDIIYIFSLQLVDSGYIGLAFKLSNEFKYINTDLEIINIKKAYLEAIFTDNVNNKVTILEDLLKLSIRNKDYRMNIRIYNSLGNYYLKDGIYEQAISCYQSACENINKVLSNVPEQFKTGLLKSCCFNEVFNKLAEVKQMKG